MNVLSLCDGMSCGQIALKEMDIKVDNYYASEIDKNAIKVTMDNFPNTVQLGDVTKIDEDILKELPKIDLVLFGSPCFSEDTLVLTDSGFKCIKDVKIGDRVLSHDNKYHKVLDSGCTGIKQITKIKIMGAEPIETTSNHKFYVRKINRVFDKGVSKRVFDKPEWKEVKDLDKNYYAGIAINQNSIIPEWNGIDYWFQWNIKHKNTLDMSSESFWYLVGAWLGDGWLRKNRKGKYRNKYNGVVYGVGEKKLDKLKNYLDFENMHYTIIKERTCYKIQLCNTEFACFLAQFGDGAKNKYLPSFVFDLPCNLLKSLLDGYFDTDGYKKYRDNEVYFIKVSSISRTLIYGIGQCIAKVYHRPFTLIKRIPEEKSRIEGRVVNNNVIYILEVRLNVNRQNGAFYEDGYLWCPIRKVEQLEDCKEVYDLTVEDAHSFTANGVIVHNCRSLSKCSQTIRNGVDYNNGLNGISGLFVNCVNILNYIKENNNKDVYFLAENVNVSKKNEKDLDKMTELIGVEPVLIDSELFSAQGRLRNYWTNIPLGELPNEETRNKQVVKDIFEDNVDNKYYYEQDFDYYGLDKRQVADLHIKGFDLIRRVMNPNFKSYTLTACRGGNTQMKVLDLKRNQVRKLTPLEYRRLQTIPDWYKMDVADGHIYNMCGDGWNINTICYLLNYLKGI